MVQSGTFFYLRKALGQIFAEKSCSVLFGTFPFSKNRALKTIALVPLCQLNVLYDKILLVSHSAYIIHTYVIVEIDRD